MDKNIQKYEGENFLFDEITGPLYVEKGETALVHSHRDVIVGENQRVNAVAVRPDGISNDDSAYWLTAVTRDNIYVRSIKGDFLHMLNRKTKNGLEQIGLKEGDILTPMRPGANYRESRDNLPVFVFSEGTISIKHS